MAESDSLISGATVARRLGITRSAVSNWLKRDVLPHDLQPERVQGGHPVWRESQLSGLQEWNAGRMHVSRTYVTDVSLSRLLPGDVVLVVGNGHATVRRSLSLRTCGQCDGGLVPVDGCTCGGGLWPYGHEPLCGTEPCPNGCWWKLHPDAPGKPSQAPPGLPARCCAVVASYDDCSGEMASAGYPAAR